MLIDRNKNEKKTKTNKQAKEQKAKNRTTTTLSKNMQKFLPILIKFDNIPYISGPSELDL